MARKCTVCEHPEVVEINKCLVNNESLRNIAKQFPGITSAAVNRHKAHLPGKLVKAQEEKQIIKNVTVLEEIKRCFERVNKLFDACDKWLSDPETGEYNLNPRAGDIEIIYTEPGPNGKDVRKKALLSKLLAEVRGAGYLIESWESRIADPRTLILHTSRQLGTQIELLSKLLHMLGLEERLKTIEEKLQKRGE